MLNNLYLGTTKPKKYYMGEFEALKIYLGSTLVYQREDVWVFKDLNDPPIYYLPAYGSDSSTTVPSIVSTKNDIPHRFDVSQVSTVWLHSNVSHTVPPGSGDDNVISTATIYADDNTSTVGKPATVTYRLATTGTLLTVAVYQHCADDYTLETSVSSIVFIAEGASGNTVTVTSTRNAGGKILPADFTYSGPSWVTITETEVNGLKRLMVNALDNPGRARNGVITLTLPGSKKTLWVLVKLDANSSIKPYLQPTSFEIGAQETKGLSVDYYPNETVATVLNLFGWITVTNGHNLVTGNIILINCSANNTLKDRSGYITVTLSNGDKYTVSILLRGYWIEDNVIK